MGGSVGEAHGMKNCQPAGHGPPERCAGDRPERFGLGRVSRRRGKPWAGYGQNFSTATCRPSGRGAADFRSSWARVAGGRGLFTGHHRFHFSMVEKTAHMFNPPGPEVGQGGSHKECQLSTNLGGAGHPREQSAPWRILLAAG